MYENLSYEQLKELPGEQKKNALMQLKEQYPHYKEMAEKIGGTPTALSNLYLRIVEGRKFGRKKKVVIEPTIVETTFKAPAEAPAEAPVKLRRTRRKSIAVPDFQPVSTINEQRDVLEMPVKKAISFTINLGIEETGNEAKSRIEGIIGSLLKEKIYNIKMSIEEV
jgi:hypothetical protein